MKSSIDWRNLTPRLTTTNFIILSAVMVIFIFLVQGNAGFNLEDEGFLWYGTIRTALGAVPIRDFQSYDPGRYYWGVIWFKLLRNDGIMTLRISQAAFQFVGLTFAFLILKRVLRNWLSLITASFLLLIWMFPPWKIYEPVILIIAIYLAVLLFENPSTTRHLGAGVFVGLAAFFGRNHGLYCAIAFLLLVVFVWWRKDWRALVVRLAVLSLGIVIGYLPMILMFAFVRGFFASVVDGVLFNLHYGTNLPLPVPWPWRIINYSHTFREGLTKFAIGVTYLAFPVFYLFAAISLLLKPKARAHAVLVACTFLGAAYLHYAFDRPHLYYLAWTVPPFILGVLSLPDSFPAQYRRVLGILVWSSLLLITWTAAEMAPENYFLIKIKGAARAALSRRAHVNVGLDLPIEHYDLVRTDIRGDQLWLTSDIAEVVNQVNAVNREFIPANENLLVAPYWDGFYPILHKESPTREIYFLFPQPLTEQEKIVEDLERNRVRWAFVCHSFLDGRPELAFRNTHAYVWQYLSANFEHVNGPRLPADCELLRKTVSAQPGSGPPATSATKDSKIEKAR